MRNNARCFFRGLWRTLCGAFVASGIAAAAYVYTLVPGMDGWDAVIRFVVATIMAFLSLYLVWGLGGGHRRIITVEEG